MAGEIKRREKHLGVRRQNLIFGLSHRATPILEVYPAQ
jgi:hypothetical protein